MSKKTSDLSLSLARREKRLRYWYDCLLKNGTSLDSTIKERLGKLLKDFRSTLAKYATSEDTDHSNTNHSNEYENTLSNIERELDSTFESRRLMTSKIGVPAVGD